MKLSLALLAVVSAGPAAQQASQHTAARADADAAQQHSYASAAPQESYDAEPEIYEGADPGFHVAPRLCVSCDESAPCWNGAGCTALVQSAPSQFWGGAQQTYATQDSAQQMQNSYRHLQGQQTYSATQEYPAQHHEAPRFSGSCPCGSVDTRSYRMHNNVVLWIAFALLFVPGVAYLWSGWENLKTGAITTDRWSTIRMCSGIVNMVASLAYLTMALGHGYVTKCNGRDFYYARYIDWAITTPIMLYDFIEISSGNGLTQTYLVVMDIFMIVAGLIGELIEGDEKWAFFGFSMLAFIPIMWFLLDLAKDVAGGENQKLYRNVVALTLLSWIGYPIIWILASVSESIAACDMRGYAAQEGYRALAAASVQKVGVISVQGEAYAYTVLDIIAKSVVGWMICFHKPTVEMPETLSALN